MDICPHLFGGYFYDSSVGRGVDICPHLLTDHHIFTTSCSPNDLYMSLSPVRSAGATLPVTRPSLAAVSALYRLNSKQSVAFYTAASILLRAFLACDDTFHGETERATAFSHIERHLTSHGGGQVLMYLGGEGGTGKSTCICAIEHFSLAWGLRSTLALTAPTGAAAVVINGCTIHSFVGINSCGRSSVVTTSAQAVESALSGIVLLILDEISLVSAELLGKISHTMSMKRGNLNARFGGVNMMFSGDFGQLEPVSGHALWDDAFATTGNNPTLHTALVGLQIWANELTGCVMLDENYRAIGDPDFVAFLRRARRNACTVADVGQLEQRRVRRTLVPALDTAVAFYTNAEVNATNCNRVHQHAKKIGAAVHRLYAAISGLGRPPPAPIPPTGPAHAGYVVGTGQVAKLPYSALDVFIGVPVTITVKNTLTAYGVANGSRGFLVGSHPPFAELAQHTEEIILADGQLSVITIMDEAPSQLFVEIPGSSVQYAGLPRGVLPIAATTKKMHVHGHPAKMRVTQFDIKLNYSRKV